MTDDDDSLVRKFFRYVTGDHDNVREELRLALRRMTDLERRVDTLEEEVGSIRRKELAANG